MKKNMKLKHTSFVALNPISVQKRKFRYNFVQNNAFDVHKTEKNYFSKVDRAKIICEQTQTLFYWLTNNRLGSDFLLSLCMNLNSRANV